MANLHHDLAIPGYIALLLVLWGWLPLFVVGWLLRKMFQRGPRTPEEEARQFPRPAPGWLGPEVVEPPAEDSSLQLLQLLNDDDQEQHRQHDKESKKQKNNEAETLELRRRALEKKRRESQRKKMELARQKEQEREGARKARVQGSVRA